MGRGSGTLVKYGKIEIVAEASLDEVIGKLDKLLKDHGYPESADEIAAGDARIENLQGSTHMDSEDASGLTEEDIDDMDELEEGTDIDAAEEEEESTESSPWDVARRKLAKGEDDDGGEK